MQIVSKFAAKLDMGGKRWSGWSKTVSQDALLRLHPWSLSSTEGGKKKKKTTGNKRLCIMGVDYSSMFF